MTLRQSVETIWRTALRLDHLEETADFYALGGTSLELALILADAKEQLDVEFDLFEFIEQPNFQRLYSIIERTRGAQA